MSSSRTLRTFSPLFNDVQHELRPVCTSCGSTMGPGPWEDFQRQKLTTYRIQTWALEEARRRLEAEGILEDPDKVQGK